MKKVKLIEAFTAMYLEQLTTEAVSLLRYQGNKITGLHFSSCVWEGTINYSVLITYRKVWYYRWLLFYWKLAYEGRPEWS